MRPDVRTGKISRKLSAKLSTDRMRQKASGELMLISQTPLGNPTFPESTIEQLEAELQSEVKSRSEDDGNEH